MCGIAGIVYKDAEASVSEEALVAMCATLHHRGPDDSGVFTDGRVGLGMTRLSIIDVAGGHQPIFSEDRRCAIVFNGEIYNHNDLRRELERRGHRYSTNSDTESILHAYEEYGTDCVKHLRGMFAFAVWDGPRGRLFLARDRLGLKPLHYLHDGRRFVFGSEMKAVLTLPDVERRVNAQALVDFVAWGYVPDPESIYEGVWKLPPAHWLTYEDGRVRIERYWDVQYETPVKVEREEFYVERALEILDEAVRIRLMSEVPLGAFLSGGTDSSVVVALMAKHSRRPVKTFSIGFEEPEYNELPYARKVAQYFKTDHHEEVVRPDAEKDILDLVRTFDEPFSDSSMLPSYYVARLARKHVTVALSGDGGDEAFAGYTRYLDVASVRLGSRIPVGVRRALLGAAVAMLPPGARGRDRIYDLMGTPDEQYLRRMTRGVGQAYDDMFSRATIERVNTDPTRIARPILSRVRHADVLSRRQYLDIHTFLPGDILRKVDRTSMKVSLEAREPLLDHVLVEFCATIPPELRMKGMTTKYILKKVAERLLPREMVHRPKMGFGIPVAYWLRKEWVAQSLDLVLGKRALDRGWFRPEFLRRIIDEHRRGVRDNSGMIWTLMMLELWWRDWPI